MCASEARCFGRQVLSLRGERDDLALALEVLGLCVAALRQCNWCCDQHIEYSCWLGCRRHRRGQAPGVCDVQDVACY